MGLTKDLGSIPRAITVSGSNNNVGIGTTTPGAKVHIGESGTAAQLWLQRTDGYNPVKLIGGTLADGNGFKVTMNTTDAFAITSGGNVGIGTESPGTKLDVNGTGRIQGQLTVRSGSGTKTVLETTRTFGVNRNFQIAVDEFAEGKLTITPSTTEGGSGYTTPVLTINATGNIGIGTTSPTATLNIRSLNSLNSDSLAEVITRSELKIQYRADDLSSMYFGGLGSQRGFIQGVNNAENAGADISINPYGGNVGIGVVDLGPDGVSLPTTFNYAWSEGSGNAYATLFRQRNSAATVIASGYKRSNTGAFASSFGISMARSAIAVGSNNGSIAFFSDAATNVTNGTDITPSERMTILNNGNVGIGTTNPGARLEINAASGFPIMRVAGGGDGTGGGKGNIRSSDQGGTNFWDFGRDNLTTGNFVLTSGGGSPVLSITTSGAATFSSSVTATSAIINNSVGNDLVYLDAGVNTDYAFKINSGADDMLTLRRQHVSQGNRDIISFGFSGNVGIGTTSPNNRLYIVSSAQNSGLSVMDFNGAGGWGGGINLGVTGLSLETLGKIYTSLTNSGPGSVAGDLRFQTATGGALFDRMTITSGGTVQINNNQSNGVVGTNFIAYALSSNSFFRLGNNTSNSLDIQLTRSDSATMFSVNGHSGAGFLNSSAWSYSSDLRIKENIIYIETGLEKIMALKPAKFDYINGIKNNIGWIAQDVQNVIPEAVNVVSEDNDQLTLKSDFIIPYLVKAIQEQQALIKELQDEVVLLKNK